MTWFHMANSFVVGTAGILSMTGFDMTQVIVGLVAALGVIGAAMANSRGRKQEKATDAVIATQAATNDLVDQLQESLLDYRDENRELRERIAALDSKVVGLELQVRECHEERDELRRMVEELTTG